MMVSVGQEDTLAERTITARHVGGSSRLQKIVAFRNLLCYNWRVYYCGSKGESQEECIMKSLSDID